MPQDPLEMLYHTTDTSLLPAPFPLMKIPVRNPVPVYELYGNTEKWPLPTKCPLTFILFWCGQRTINIIIPQISVS